MILLYVCKFKFNAFFSSVQFGHLVMSNSLRPHELQHARPPCPSPTPGVYSNSCPSSRWCHPAISSSVVPFSSCPQSLPASGSFPMSQLLPWGGQSIGVPASASVLPMNTQDLSPSERQIPYDIACMWNLIKGSLGLKGDPTSQSNPEYSLEGLMLKLKLQNFGHLIWRADSLEKTLMLGKTESKRIRR